MLERKSCNRIMSLKGSIEDESNDSMKEKLKEIRLTIIGKEASHHNGHAFPSVGK